MSPDCADAYVLLAEDDARSVGRAKSYFEQGMAAGERALGDKFDEYVGHFWGVTETRPYMRTRRGLASCLWSMGDTDAAVEHYHEMLRLNPNDNQGIRYELLYCLLEKKDEAGVEGNEAPYNTATDKVAAKTEWPMIRALCRGLGRSCRKDYYQSLRCAITQ